jgi:hypothetical protein
MPAPFMDRPSYQALNGEGLEYRRPALVIGELPWEARAAALDEATTSIARALNLTPQKAIPFGAPLFTAFVGMTRPIAKRHARSALLLTKGDDVPLDYCASYIAMAPSH